MVNKKLVNFSIEEEVYRKLKILCAENSKFVGSYLNILIKQEIEKWEREHGTIQIKEKV